MMMIAVRRTREGERERKKNKTPLKRRDPPRGVQGESSQTIFFPERERHIASKKQTHLEKTPTVKRARERVADACISSLRGGVWMRVREPVKACARDVVVKQPRVAFSIYL